MISCVKTLSLYFTNANLDFSFHVAQDHAAYPLFLMYRAIKCQTEKGPIDMVTGKSYISLNDENIIQEQLSFEDMVSSLGI